MLVYRLVGFLFGLLKSVQSWIAQQDLSEKRSCPDFWRPGKVKKANQGTVSRTLTTHSQLVRVNNENALNLKKAKKKTFSFWIFQLLVKHCMIYTHILMHSQRDIEQILYREQTFMLIKLIKRNEET